MGRDGYGRNARLSIFLPRLLKAGLRRASPDLPRGPNAKRPLANGRSAFDLPGGSFRFLYYDLVKLTSETLPWNRWSAIMNVNALAIV